MNDLFTKFLGFVRLCVCVCIILTSCFVCHCSLNLGSLLHSMKRVGILFFPKHALVELLIVRVSAASF